MVQVSINLMNRTNSLLLFGKITTMSKFYLITWHLNHNQLPLARQTWKEKVKASQSKCIIDYNKWFGGIDRINWFINKYRTKIRVKR